MATNREKLKKQAWDVLEKNISKINESSTMYSLAMMLSKEIHQDYAILMDVLEEIIPDFVKKHNI